jgi:hypothetical protein
MTKVKLVVRKETLRQLSGTALARVVGGETGDTAAAGTCAHALVVVALIDGTKQPGS